MKRWILGLCAALLAGVFVAEEVEAKRLGGARSSGVQRSATPPAKPAQQQQAAPQQGQQQNAAQGAAPAGAQPAASGMGRWAPILGGLALGGVLGYLFGGNGLMGILLLVALAFVAVMAFRAFARRGQQAPQRMQYAGMGNETVAAPPPS